MSKKVFISYARSDAPFVLRFATSLRQSGFDVWVDQLDIPAGHRWDREIQSALESCPAFLIVLSPAAVASDNVLDEVNFALEHRKDIVPVLYQKCDVPFRLRRFQHFDHTGDESAALAHFATSLNRLQSTAVGSPVATPLPPLPAPLRGEGRGEGRTQVTPDLAWASLPNPLPVEVQPTGRGDGRIFISAPHIHGAPSDKGGGWFLPGNGKTEWFKDHVNGPEMVVVPGNRSARSRTSHAFAIGRFATTFAEWDAAQGHRDWERHSGVPPRKANDYSWGRGRRPVIDVSLWDAMAYRVWLSKVTSKSYRLPANAEWEYCCRASSPTEFWWGDEISTEQANYNGNSTCGKGKKGKDRKQTVPVDSFEPNPWGLYQVHGNVWEWCEDKTDASSRQSSGCGLRGGSWIEHPLGLRSRYRNDSTGFDRRDRDIGFRLARTL